MPPRKKTSRPAATPAPAVDEPGTPEEQPEPPAPPAAPILVGERGPETFAFGPTLNEVRASEGMPPAAPPAALRSPAPLVMLVPSLGRPESAPRMVEAWRATGGFEAAELMFVVSAAELPAYQGACGVDQPLWRVVEATKLVPRLNEVARELALDELPWLRHLGFMGDDHLPRSAGWTGTYVEQLDELEAAHGAGMVYPDDGHRGEKLATSWAMSMSWVRAIGRMVPALVEHMWCDNAVQDLAKAAGVARYLPGVLVEHMHPMVGKGAKDATYALSGPRYEPDRKKYVAWASRPENARHADGRPYPGLVSQAAKLRALHP